MPHLTDTPEPIAIIGLACRFPGGANSPDELWDMLANGRSGWSEIPEDRYNWKAFHHPHPDAEAAHNQRGGGYINRDLAAFDAAFFNIPATEAHALDPQQRIQLETAYEALENAGLPLDSIRKSKTSVHVATVSRDYDRNAYRDPQDLAKYHLTGCGEAITSGRVSYTFDLTGPCFSLDTGCSGSLVGLHLAVQGLRSRESDMGLVGGTNLLLSPDMTIAMSKLHMLNDDGRCYAFDSRGSGYARSEGVGTIVLKRLSDALKAGDPIRAIVRSTGINQDGKTNGIMLPNSQAQEDLMRSVHLDAGLNPAETAYVEAHGTGTKAGDNAEIRSISEVFCTNVQRNHPLIVGSVKANIGHCESASGLAGLIKTVLALERGRIPPTPDLVNVKEGLDFERRNIIISQRLEKWPDLDLRRAAINSFGYGGTNVAAVLEHYQPRQTRNEINGTNGYHSSTDFEPPSILMVMSAKTPTSLAGNLKNLASWMQDQQMPPKRLRDLAFTLARRRAHFLYRISLSARTSAEFVTATSDSSSTQKSFERALKNPRVTFVFTGQGAQWYAMGRELMHTQSAFADSIHASEEILKRLGAPWSLQEELSRDQTTSQINKSELSQPVTTALQIALVDVLGSFSVHPGSVVGHSSGEIAAAYAAGAISHEAALWISFARAKASQMVNQAGAMLVTTLNEAEAWTHIQLVGTDRLCLACVNSPTSTTISGDRDAVDELKSILEEEGVMAKLLAVDVAYHSHHMRTVAGQYLNSLQDIETSPPLKKVQFFSSVTGELKTSGFGPQYWVENLVSTVRFSDALLASSHQALSGSGPQSTMPQILLEIGPHAALGGPAKQTLNSAEKPIEHKYLSALTRGKNACDTLRLACGKLFEYGFSVDVEAVNSIHGGAKPREMIRDLPPYAWDYSNRYWHESRLSREYRFRRYPYHDLLGLRLIGSTPLEPIWRNILSRDAQPWLEEHIIDGQAILPGSSFITMAMEAFRQLNEERGGPNIKRFHLSRIQYSKPVVIPDSPGKVEVMISLSETDARATTPVGFSGWEQFRMTSSHDAKTWFLNCQGYIRLEYNRARTEETPAYEEEEIFSRLRKRVVEMEQSCSQRLGKDSIYSEMRQNGVDYGTNFATIQEIRLGECQALGRVVIPDVAKCMPSGYQQPHTIHPATFDALMHIVLPLYFRHCTAGTVMLTSIEEVSIAADMLSTPGSQLDVCAVLSPMGARSGSVDVCAFQKLKHNNDPAPVVILGGQRFQGIMSSSTPVPSFTLKQRPLYGHGQPLKLAVGTPGVISSLCFVPDEAAQRPIAPDEVEIKPSTYALADSDVDYLLGRNDATIGQCAGVITALGSDFKHAFQIGDRVCSWNPKISFASKTRVKGSFVQKLPDSWSFEKGVLCQDISIAYYAFHNLAQLSRGQKVLVYGAGSPLGQAAMFVGALLGAHVIATVASRQEKEALESLGELKPAHYLHTKDPALSKGVLRLTEGVGVDVIFNASLSSVSEEVVSAVGPFGLVIDIQGHTPHHQPPSLSNHHHAVRLISFSIGQLLRHRESSAAAAFKQIFALLHDKQVSLPTTACIPIQDVFSGVKAVQAGRFAGLAVLTAEGDVMVNVREAAGASASLDLANVERLMQAVNELTAPQDQKDALLALLAESGATSSSETTEPPGTSKSSQSNIKPTIDRRLARASSTSEACAVISEELITKMAALVAVRTEQLDLKQPLADLGLDSLIAIEFKNWLGRTLGADIRVHDLLDATLESLVDIVIRKSKYVPVGLPKESTLPKQTQNRQSVLPIRATNGSLEKNQSTLVVVGDQEYEQTQSISCRFAFKPNDCPNYPLPDLNVLLDAYLASCEPFATEDELANTKRIVEDFKRPGSAGRALYNRAAAIASRPSVKNWEAELQIRRCFLDRRAPLVPFGSFWFSHPLSKQAHAQAERAALLAFTANQYRKTLEAGQVQPLVLNERELTTAFYPWIFNAARIPHVGSDEIERYPGNDYCVAFWRGHAFRVDLCGANRDATYQELLSAFDGILAQMVERSNVGMLTCDNRHSWGEKRPQLQQLNPVNASSVGTIEAAAFLVCLDEGSPTDATERARQFHFGGVDAANRWNDKSLQFAVCSNGVSGIVADHTMLDALTVSELNEAIATAIDSHIPRTAGGLQAVPGIEPAALPLELDAELKEHITKIEANYAASTATAEHAYLLFEDYGSAFLRAHKLAPKSVFQIIVQLASLFILGYISPCWETVSLGHYHQGRVDIIQLITPAIYSFLSAARDASIPLSRRRELLVDAVRSHVVLVSKSGRALGWERDMTAFRALVEKDEPVPDLYEDEVYKRIRPRKIMSHCFETGMMEKGFLLKDPQAVWDHYEVYENSVYFSVVTQEPGRATRFCEYLKDAAALVKEIVLANVQS